MAKSKQSIKIYKQLVNFVMKNSGVGCGFERPFYVMCGQSLQATRKKLFLVLGDLTFTMTIFNSGANTIIFLHLRANLKRILKHENNACCPPAILKSIPRSTESCFQ